MENQNYGNHRRYVPGYHYVMFTLVLVFLVLAVINMVQVGCTPGWLYSGVMPLIAALIFALIFFYIRKFPVKAQDRAIRAEENFRHYILTGKQLDSKLTIGQIAALRFAGDDEYLALVQRAIAESMKPDDIKKVIKNWRSDVHRC